MLIVCPHCARTAPTFQGGTIVFCAACLVTGRASVAGPENSPVWVLIPFECFVVSEFETRPRLVETS